MIEPRGLVRIKSHVGKLPQPRSFEDAAEILRHHYAAQFPRLSPEDWLAFARRSFRERGAKLVPTYDVKLSKTLQGVELERGLPTLWTEFDALAALPLMVVRGASSDILSAETVAAMRSRRANLELLEVADQGTPRFSPRPTSSRASIPSSPVRSAAVKEKPRREARRGLTLDRARHAATDVQISRC